MSVEQPALLGLDGPVPDRRARMAAIERQIVELACTTEGGRRPVAGLGRSMPRSCSSAKRPPSETSARAGRFRPGR